MVEFNLIESPKKFKKYRVIIKTRKGERIIDFGDTRYEDYTKHKDLKRKKAYILRHQKNEDWDNYLTAGYWSRWLLWNKPSLLESYLDVKNKLKVINTTKSTTK